MPYKTIAVGAEALAVDANDYFMRQVVARFPDTATRAAQLPAPLAGQLSELENRVGIIQVFNGAAWVDTYASPTVFTNGTWAHVPGLISLTLPTIFTTNSEGGINFAFPFQINNPTVVLTNCNQFALHVYAPYEWTTPTSAAIFCASPNGIPLANAGVVLGIAIFGTRP